MVLGSVMPNRPAAVCLCDIESIAFRRPWCWCVACLAGPLPCGFVRSNRSITLFTFQLFRDFLDSSFDFDKNLSLSMYLISIYLFATAIPLQLWTISGFPGDSSFVVAIVEGFLVIPLEFKRKISSNVLYFLLEVCYCESSSTFNLPSDSSFRIAIV